MRPKGYREALQRLNTLYSFVQTPENADGKSEVLSEDDTVIGTYINGPDHFILITTKGLHWIRNGIDRFIAYSTLSAVALPEDDADRELKLTFQDGNVLYLEVLNDTEEYPDLYEVYEFMSSLVNWPFSRPLSAIAAQIETRSDLMEFLRQEDYGWSDHINTVFALDEGFPQLWQLRELDIDPNLLNKPATWRLLALFLAIYSQSNGDEDLWFSR
jgi:hypothetical protein